MKKLKKQTHGELQCYRAGCRCELCKKANTESLNKYYRQNREKWNAYVRNRRAVIVRTTVQPVDSIDKT